MPDTDGYAVCTQVKQHAQFGHIPVVLMSGVVNKTVADRAVSVRADELIRKPFQPQELCGREQPVPSPKQENHPPPPTARPALPSMPGIPSSPSSPSSANSLSSLFA